MLAVLNEDLSFCRFRPMKVRKQVDADAYYLDIGGEGAWSKSTCGAYCRRHGIPYDVCSWGDGIECRHVVNDGKKNILSMKCERMPSYMKADDIIEGRINKAKKGTSK